MLDQYLSVIISLLTCVLNMNLQNILMAKTNDVCAQLCFYSILIPVNQYRKY